LNFNINALATKFKLIFRLLRLFIGCLIKKTLNYFLFTGKKGFKSSFLILNVIMSYIQKIIQKVLNHLSQEVY